MHKYLNKILVALFILWGSEGYLSAQMISVNATVDRDSIQIGEQLVFAITVTKDSSIDFSLPDYADTLSSRIEILNDEGYDTLSEAGRMTITRKLKITSFDEGLQIIPAQAVTFNWEGRTDTLLTSFILLKVYAPEVDTTQAIMPVKPPVNTPLSFEEIMPWTFRGLLILLGLSLIIALIWILLHREKLSGFLSQVKDEPAHVIAFRELDRLKDEKLPEQGRVKEFYIRLTEIVRRYIEKQYGIPAMETTTLEILKMFSVNNTDDQILDDMLRDLLELADLVKFAKQDPLPVENQTNLNNAYLFVQKTYPLFIAPGTDEKKENEDVEPDETELGNE